MSSWERDVTDRVDEEAVPEEQPDDERVVDEGAVGGARTAGDLAGSDIPIDEPEADVIEQRLDVPLDDERR